MLGLRKARCGLIFASVAWRASGAFGRARRRGAIALLCTLLAMSLGVEAASAAPAMTVPGSFRANNLGAATYSIPIAASPGTAGMVPALSLDYSSLAGDGIVGYGWMLSGLPTITRCPRTLTQDSVHGSVNFDSNDRYCFAGQRLDATAGTYGADGTIYQTQVSNFMRIVSHGTAGSGPSYFTVITTAGVTLEFGNTTDSKLLAVGKSSVRVWALDKVADTKGNYYTVTYTNDSTNGQIYPTRIDYTGNTGASLTPYNSVQFTYNASRSDVTPFYQAGSLQQTTVLLTHIKTYQGANLVLDYQLGYRAGTSTLHSRLTSVTLCDTGGTVCLPATTFGWQGGAGLPTMTGTSDGTTQGYALQAGDFNGDGLTDAVAVSNTSCPSGSVIYSGSNSGTFTASNMTATYDYHQQAVPHNMVAYSGPACFLQTTTWPTHFGDFFGRGQTDVATTQKNWLYDGCCSYTPQNYTALLKNSAAGALNQTVSDNFLDPNMQVGDFNGDGRTDFFDIWGGSAKALFSNGDSTFTSDGGDPAIDTASVLTPADFDGDGCTDLLTQGSTNLVKYFCNPAASSVSVTNYSSSTVVQGDFNGDGKTDLLVISSTAATIYLSTGTSFTSGYTVSSSSAWHNYKVVAGDWDGDGRTDVVLVSQASGTSHLVFLSTGTDFTQVSTISNSDTAPTAVAADWNNDGGDDFWLKKTSGDVLYTFAYAPEAITSISNGIGATIGIAYDRLNKNGTFYAKGTTSTYPNEDIDGAYYAVSSAGASDGIGGTHTTSYAYQGAVADATEPPTPGIGGNLLASRILAFATVKATDSVTGIVTTMNYHTDQPYIGMMASETVVSGSVTLYSLANTLSSSGGFSGGFVASRASKVESWHDVDGTALPSLTTNYTYDAYNNPKKIVRTWSDGTVTVTTNTFNSDLTHWILGELLTQSFESVVGSYDQTRHYSYSHDSTSGQLTQAVLEPSTSALKLTTDYGYDSFGNPTTVTQSGVDITTRTASTTAYDTKGEFATSVSNALSQSTSLSFSAAFGAPTGSTDPNSQSRSLSYDTLGRTTLATAPDGNKAAVAYAYCSGVAGGSAICPTYGAYVVTVTPQNSSGTANGPVSTTYYDALGRVIEADTQGFDGTTIHVATAYDSAGHVHTVSRPYLTGATPVYTTFTDDVLGRVTQATMPDSSTTTTAYHGLSMSVTNNLSQTTTTVRNVNGWITSVTDALSHAVSYTYDSFGNVVSTTDSLGNVITSTYDIRGRRTASTDPDLGSWSYGYDVLSELTSQTDANSQSTAISYDTLGRPLTRSESGLYSTWTWGTSSASHNVGQLTEAKACTASGCATVVTDRTFSYDAYARPSSNTLAVDGGSYTYSQTYNSDGRLATVAYPSGFTAKHLYNATGYECAVGDNSGSPTCSTPTSNIWTAGSANADLSYLTQTLGNGVAETDTYDGNTGRLTNVRAGPSNTIAQFDYTWDTIGNLTYRSDDLHAVYEKYCYDGLNRLTNSATAATTPSACSSTGTGITSKTVAYDAIGNITSKSDVGTYSYPASGSSSVRPHAVSSITGTVNGVTNPTYTYDANGNLTAGAGRTITPTSYNVASSIAQGTTTIGYTYNESHARVKKCFNSTCGGTVIHYLNDPTSGASSAVISAGSTSWMDYIKAGGVYRAIRVCAGASPCTSSVTWRYLTSDHLGSVAITTSASGTVLASESYDAWGKRRNIDGTDATACSLTTYNGLGFTGHEMVDQVCEINANARIYDPVVARFLSADTIVPDPTYMQSLNRYSYTNDNPLNATDPSGHDSDNLYKQPTLSDGTQPVNLGDGLGDDIHFGTDWASMQLGRLGGEGGGVGFPAGVPAVSSAFLPGWTLVHLVQISDTTVLGYAYQVLTSLPLGQQYAGFAGGEPSARNSSGPSSATSVKYCSRFILGLGNWTRQAAHDLNQASAVTVSWGAGEMIWALPSALRTRGITAIPGAGAVAIGVAGFRIANNVEAIGAFAQYAATGDSTQMNEVAERDTVEDDIARSTGLLGEPVTTGFDVWDGFADAAGESPTPMKCQ
jgi:RHS repeat-associated protein